MNNKAAGRYLVFILLMLGASSLSLADQTRLSGDPDYGRYQRDRYEVWASDQSNSVVDAGAAGVRGSFLWIWDSRDIDTQLAGGAAAEPLGCGPARRHNRATTGPCDLLQVFPQDLIEVDHRGRPTGKLLGDLDGFARLHGMIVDPQERYLTVNVFAPSGGYVGIIDSWTKEAVSLFRVTGSNVGGGTDVRSVHMSFWNSDGSAILVANLNGKLLERIDVRRDRRGRIRRVAFNRHASLGVGKGMQITSNATAFIGRNAHGRAMIGRIVGQYSTDALGDLTSNGLCKENDCGTGANASNGGRPNNLIICPITSESDKVYVTLGGGGLLVADTRVTPMQIVGEYGNEVVNGAGCGGIQAGDAMWLNAGVSASAAGATQSTWTLYSLEDSQFSAEPNSPDLPLPIEIYKDVGNTATNGNSGGLTTSNDSGQLPGITSRRDAHGMAITLDGEYIHIVDRIRNRVDVFHTDTLELSTYDLTSQDGQGLGEGACAETSVTDDDSLPSNDPAPDLMESTPDGKYLMIAFRGPAPVTVNHSAQGSCPGVGVVELQSDGGSGKLIGVLRTHNLVDNSAASAPGGHDYSGLERSDIHAVEVVTKNGHRH